MSQHTSEPVDGSVEVSIVTADGPELCSVGGGALRVSVDGTRVTRFVNEAALEWGEWDPEYVGDFLALDLPAILERLERLLRGEVERYDSLEHTFEGWRYYLLFEPVTDEHLRLAFQTHEQLGDGSEVPTPHPESARGYLVNLDDLSRAALEAGRAYQRRAETYEVAEPAFATFLDEFEALLE
ncbi:hypothetical protein [Natronobiforma cellulositropha]|uniref:hypothetical protein n=1 Tax=Natronobiforma cellulositropha TaxID=1679076 RepID=UPI0021D5F0E2|nr:hypothetical protein [Natronobiforma cellulositropha]